jgi:hypothetical protein
MSAIKVRATAVGIYMGRKYLPGMEFVLVDQKDAVTGKVLQTAEKSLSEKGVVRGGWMERVVVAAKEDPQVVLDRELEAAQAIADAKARELAEAGLTEAQKQAQAHGSTPPVAQKVGVKAEGLGPDAKDNANPSVPAAAEEKKTGSPSEVL